MSLSIFPYVGGKSELAPWIIDHLPDHDCYVEPFAGSASVLINKPRSKVEVLNDLDGDVVQFFEVCRDRADELSDFVYDIPYSRELYQRWANEFYDGNRPDDAIERAGRWLFLRYASFGGKYGHKSGFCRASHLNAQPPSKIWAQAPERVDETRERLRGVEIECLDALDLIGRYDSENTVFYCDPPYVGCHRDYYMVDGLDHDGLEACLSAIEGYTIVSYGLLPEAFGEEWYVKAREYTQRARRGSDDWKDNATERICLNFDPTRTPKFVDVGHRQDTLAFTKAIEGGDSE